VCTLVQKALYKYSSFPLLSLIIAQTVVFRLFLSHDTLVTFQFLGRIAVLRM